MTGFQIALGGRRCCLYQSAPDAAVETILLQCADERELAALAPQAEAVRAGAPEQGFVLAAVSVADWSRELSPWEAPPVFGEEPFGDGAEETLRLIRETLLPRLRERFPNAGRLFLGGYSLAGLFALWAGFVCPDFDGVAGVSPSVWFPGWLDFAAERKMLARAVYLSLGDREEKTRHPVMAGVGDAVRATEALLRDAGVPCTLEWNPGNHFRDAPQRTAGGFLWLMRGH